MEASGPILIAEPVTTAGPLYRLQPLVPVTLPVSNSASTASSAGTFVDVPADENEDSLQVIPSMVPPVPPAALDELPVAEQAAVASTRAPIARPKANRRMWTLPVSPIGYRTTRPGIARGRDDSANGRTTAPPSFGGAYDRGMRSPRAGHVLRLLAVAVPSLAIATIAASLLEDVIGVPNASAVYLAAVVDTALVAGTLRPGTGLSEEDQLDSADAIDREVEYLNRLVTNLLDLSRIEGGALRADRDVFELDDLVGQTVERLRARLGSRPLEIDLGAPPVTVDPVLLDEAVTNALENAIKYTSPGTAVRITAAPLPDEPLIRLTVEDAGPGVPDDALPRLFEKFYRVPGVAGGSRSGTGIGLAVVRGLVEAMGGRVGARRSELGGLAIDIDLEAAAVPTVSPGSGTP